MVSFNTNVCPDIVYYTKEEQKEIDRIIKKENNIILNRFVIDYYNLREKIRICEGVK